MAHQLLDDQWQTPTASTMETIWQVNLSEEVVLLWSGKTRKNLYYWSGYLFLCLGALFFEGIAGRLLLRSLPEDFGQPILFIACILLVGIMFLGVLGLLVYGYSVYKRTPDYCAFSETHLYILKDEILKTYLLAEQYSLVAHWHLDGTFSIGKSYTNNLYYYTRFLSGGRMAAKLFERTYKLARE